MTNAISLALIGYGEVGRTFARALLARGDVEISAYDILFDDPAIGARAWPKRGQPAWCPDATRRLPPRGRVS